MQVMQAMQAWWEQCDWCSYLFWERAVNNSRLSFFSHQWLAKAHQNVEGPSAGLNGQGKVTNWGDKQMIWARSIMRQDSSGLPVIQILSNRRPAQTNRRIESLPKQPQLVPTCSRRPQPGPRNALKLLQPATDADIHWKLKNQQIILLPIKNYNMSTLVLCIDSHKVAQFRVVWLFQCQYPHGLSLSLPRIYWLLHFDNWMCMNASPPILIVYLYFNSS